jgi:hypothetical protein
MRVAPVFMPLWSERVNERCRSSGALSWRAARTSSDALRNAHLPVGMPCFVQATIIDGNGTPHTIKHTLKTDYGKTQDCEIALEIDGAAASEAGSSRKAAKMLQRDLAAA